MNRDWKAEGLCTQIGASPEHDPWFPEQGDRGHEAAAICRNCPVATECLTHALENGEQHGIWGGYNAEQRRAHTEHDTIDDDVAHFTALGWSIRDIATRLHVDNRRVSRARERNRARQATQAAAKPRGAAA